MKEPATSTTAPRPPSKVKTEPIWALGWLPVAVGMVTWIISIVHPDAYRGWFFPVGLMASIAISVAIHESAHFVVGRLVGLKVWRLTIGHGPVVFDHDFASFRLTLMASPYSGAVYPLLFAAELTSTRWKRFVMIAAGPMSNALLLIISVFLASGVHDTQNAGATSFPYEMLLANGYLLIFSLLPYRTQINGGPTMTDGLQMFRLLFFGAADTRRMIASETSTRSGSPGPSWKWIVNQIDPGQLLASYRKMLSDPNLSPEQRLHALDLFATTVLMYGANEFLEEADRYSLELLNGRPDAWTVKGTRGSILVEKGDLDGGIAMLTQVMDNDPSAFDRAIASAYLALAEWKKNDRDTALNWLRISRQLDPACPAGPRIQRLLDPKLSA
jgi:hypothetical protein